MKAITQEKTPPWRIASVYGGCPHETLWWQRLVAKFFRLHNVEEYATVDDY